jgi:drug/metabolite transporter (DMT)-like permease
LNPVKRMTRNTWHGVAVACFGITAITTIEVVALLNGFDGVLLTATIGLIAAIVAGFCGFKIARRSNGS